MRTRADVILAGVRALLLVGGVATLQMTDDLVSWGTWHQPAPLVVGAFLLGLWICTWQVFRSLRQQVTPVPIRARIAPAVAGTAAVLIVGSVCRCLISNMAHATNFPESYVESRAKVVPEALGVIFLGVAGTLLLPSRVYVQEARDPIRALLSWAALPLVPLNAYWVPLRYSVTHVGLPAGWGRLLLLSSAFGLGWTIAARRAACTRKAEPRRDLPAARVWLDVLFVTLVLHALLVAAAFVGGLNDSAYSVGMYVYPLCLVFTALLCDHWQAPRASSDALELLRTLFLSAPLAVVLVAEMAIDLPTGAGGQVHSLPMVVVPSHVAAMGTLWLMGSLAIAVVRLRVGEPARRSEDVLSPGTRKEIGRALTS